MRIESLLPVLQVDSYESALEFDVAGLGFELLMEHRHEPGFPVFMIVQRDDLMIGLYEHGRGHPGSELYVYVDDVEAWHARLAEHGIEPNEKPTNRPWGSTEMLVVDPFRNALRFTQQRTHDGTPTPNRDD